VKAYAFVWAMLVSVVTTLVLRRPDLDVLILRQPGTLAATMADGHLGNFYSVQIFNRSQADVSFDIQATTPSDATVVPIGPIDHVAPHGLAEGRLIVVLPRTDVGQAGTPIEFTVTRGGAVVQRLSSSFVGVER
jgi:polyferredoxin